jgi:hypothetical protein
MSCLRSATSLEEGVMRRHARSEKGSPGGTTDTAERTTTEGASDTACLVAALHPERLGPPAKIAVHTDDVIAFFDHFHQHPDHADLVYDVQPPG